MHINNWGTCCLLYLECQVSEEQKSALVAAEPQEEQYGNEQKFQVKKKKMCHGFVMIIIDLTWHKNDPTKWVSVNYW